MGDLPTTRLSISHPFQRTGVDYAGPIQVRLTKTRGRGTMKGYIAIFVCFLTRAVHIEAVEDYSSDAFIAAFHRFTARRGHCAELFSDQGTNFVGADADLRELFRQATVKSNSIFHRLASEDTTWHFNPPGAPHFGGLWEAAVRSTKHHLRRVIGEQVLTFVELSTVLCRIEACLNSRPLLPLTDDPTDISALTPAHFLIQRASFLVPIPRSTETRVPLGKRYEMLSQMMQHFWDRWSSEYITSLQERKKWKTTHRDIRVGDLVLIRHEITSPGKWPLARVEAVHPGKDDLVRVVTVRTATTVLKRPVAKITLLRPAESST